MKKSFAVFLGLALMAMSQFALAAAAQITYLQGKVEATPQTGATRTLKYGDTIDALDTIKTGDNSVVVMRFEDGQTAALSANSSMKVSAYTYDFKEADKGNVLLSLLTGGMRTITGIIGKTRPDRVAYQSGIYTIGIRGTDITFVTTPGATPSFVVTVNSGVISVTWPGNTTPVVIRSPAAATGSGASLTAGEISAILSALPLATQNAFNTLNGTRVRSLLQNLSTSTTTNSTVTCGVSCN